MCTAGYEGTPRVGSKPKFHYITITCKFIDDNLNAKQFRYRTISCFLYDIMIRVHHTMILSISYDFFLQ